MVQKPLLFAPGGDHRGRGLYIVHEQLVVQANLHILAAYRYTNPEGLLIRNQLLIHVAEPVKRASFLSLSIPAIAEIRIVDLDFKTLLGKAGFLVGRMEVDARIALWLSGYF